MSEINSNKRTGSLESALKGDYSFDLKSVFEEGWRLTQTDKSSIVQGMLVVVMVALFVMMIAANIAEQKGIELEDPSFRFGLDMIMAILLAPLTAALMMMGIKSSVGVKNHFSDLFLFINRTLVLTITVVMTTALVQVGLLLLLLPGLYLMIATGFAIPLVLERNMLPAKAIFTSIKVVNYQWLTFVKLYAVFFLLLLLVLVTFGIAMIWVAPFYYNVKGVLYRDIFGLSDQDGDSLPTERQAIPRHDAVPEKRDGRDDHFNA